MRMSLVVALFVTVALVALIVLLPLRLSTAEAEPNALLPIESDKKRTTGTYVDGALWVFNPSARDRKIPICWEGSAETQWKNQVDVVRAHIKATWEAAAAIEFVGWERACQLDSTAVHIAVVDAKPLVTAVGSQLLRTPGDGKTHRVRLNFALQQWPGQNEVEWNAACPLPRGKDGARQACLVAIAVHEFGHLLGLGHEHMRLHLPESDLAKADGDCVSPLGQTSIEAPAPKLIALTPWDATSVMNYCNANPNNGGKLSPMDVESVALLYCAKANPMCTNSISSTLWSKNLGGGIKFKRPSSE